MSEEILENTSEEIAEEISSVQEEVIEENSKPRTKAGMMKAIYDQLNTLKKAELSDSYESIIGATLAEQDDDEEEGESIHHIDNTNHDVVDPSPKIPRNSAPCHTDEKTHGGGQEGNVYGQTRSIHQPREHITPQMVGTQEKGVKLWRP